MVRLQKYLAQCGVASRRGSEEIIKKGKVSVNGVIVTEMGVKIDEENDIITVEGKEVRPSEKLVYIMLNKPAGFVTTVSDDRDRDTVMDLVSDIPDRIYPVGRLDYDTEGLLLLTNDGELTYKITHPKNNIEKTYVAEITGDIDMNTINRLKHGVVIDGYRTEPAQVSLLGATQLGTKIEITIHEGKNRQVRRMFEAVGCKVKSLKRTREAGLVLGHLPLGKWRRLSESEVNMLKKIGTDKVSSREKSRSMYGKDSAKHKKNSGPKKKPCYSGNGIRRQDNRKAKNRYGS